ncbi:MAG TPA: potassium channel protein [Streptosporangiaceae bacterium]|nr:potassium channel protein [Streptosporangiaceae bacterium]
MSSRETGRRDPARVPPAMLRNRILARSRLPVLVVTLAIAYGTVGYWLVEGKNMLDAFYQTMLTLSTLGVGPGPPPGPGGKIFTVSLILFGVVALFTAIGVGTEVVASGEFGRWLRMNQVSRSIGRLSGHYVICAYGRVGRAVMEEVQRRGYTAVVIESKPELEPLLAEHGVRYIPGDPADETVLRQAGIERARGLICAVDSDAANVFITLTARALNPGLRIVARASDRASVDKLVRAGADEVVSPYGLTGRRMAVLAVQPSVLEVLDLLNLGSDIRLEEVAVRAGTHLDSLTITEARARYAGVAILALKKPGSEVLANPDHQVRLAPGDLIVALGPAEILNRMAS